MALQSPFYRGIYAYVVANKPDGVTIKSSPRYRGIYAYDATKKPSGVAGVAAPASGQMAPLATGSTTEEEEAVYSDNEEPAPWDTMAQHVQLDSYIDDPANGLSRPNGWTSMTIAQKKEWLDNNG